MPVIYRNLAYVYDVLMGDVDYSNWADYLETIFRHHNTKPHIILDLGCGTGSFCIEMAKRGYDMIGADISEDMLSCAKAKTLEQGLDILYLNQDMSSFELYGTVDAVVSLVDSVNYICDIKKLENMFLLANNYLNPGGLFVFDVNSLYKYQNVLADNVFYSVDKDVSYIWQNAYHSIKKICEFDLTLFVKNKDVYRRYDEIHYQRAHEEEEILRIINKSTLLLQGQYDALTLNCPGKTSERIFYVSKKQPGEYKNGSERRIFSKSL